MEGIKRENFVVNDVILEGKFLSKAIISTGMFFFYFNLILISLYFDCHTSQNETNGINITFIYTTHTHYIYIFNIYLYIPIYIYRYI